MRPCSCPNCSAQISLDERRDFGFCPYCGTKIMLDDYRSTHRIVDEAKVHEAETERLVRLRQLEMKEKEIERKNQTKKMKNAIAACLIFIGVVCEIAEANTMLGLLLIMIGVMLFVMQDQGNNRPRAEGSLEENE